MPKRARSSKKDPRVRIAHVLESIEAVDSYVADISFEQFSQDMKTQDAVCRRLEIIGEAVRALDNLAPDLLKAYPDIPWISVKGIREKLAHDYDTISLPILWATAMEELPALRDAMKKMLADLGHRDGGKTRDA